jgi:tRNA pseudouridine55 synthase
LKRKGNPVHGWVVLDKPLGMTSTQAVSKVRWLFNANKAGHAGTLDPLATGILPIALGEATKTVSYAVEGKKTYRFTTAWGEERSTDDLEGHVTSISQERPSKERIESILCDFLGEIRQVPPAFSAVKVEGERAYDLARAGTAADLAPRSVFIEEFKLIAQPDPAHAIFEVTCGKGTYVRSLARDMGRKLGCFGHVAALRRIRLGPFTEKDAIPLATLEEMRHKPIGGNAMDGFLRPIATVLDGIPALALDDAQAQRLRLGQAVLLRGAKAPIASDAVLVTLGTMPIGICSIEQGALKPRRLFNL